MAKRKSRRGGNPRRRANTPRQPQPQAAPATVPQPAPTATPPQAPQSAAPASPQPAGRPGRNPFRWVTVTPARLWTVAVTGAGRARAAWRRRKPSAGRTRPQGRKSRRILLRIAVASVAVAVGLWILMVSQSKAPIGIPAPLTSATAPATGPSAATSTAAPVEPLPTAPPVAEWWNQATSINDPCTGELSGKPAWNGRRPIEYLGGKRCRHVFWVKFRATTGLTELRVAGLKIEGNDVEARVTVAGDRLMLVRTGTDEWWLVNRQSVVATFKGELTQYPAWN